MGHEQGQQGHEHSNPRWSGSATLQQPHGLPPRQKRNSGNSEHKNPLEPGRKKHQTQDKGYQYRSS